MNNPLYLVRKERILVSPLNWGLGHVTRCIGLISILLGQENEVIICCNAEQERVFCAVFPELQYVVNEGYPFYFKGKAQWEMDLILGLPRLMNQMRKERNFVENLVKATNATLVISDQRFGFRSDTVKSILLTHQTNLPVLGWHKLAQVWNVNLIQKFDQVWVPDFDDHRLSGKLSSPKHKSTYFIGPISRFSNWQTPLQANTPYDYLVVVSGPAPYAQAFFNEAYEALKSSGHVVAFVVPFEIGKSLPKIAAFNYFIQPNNDVLFSLFEKSKTIISRAGYTTVMDLYFTGHKALLVPTPGQKEQLYLAELHQQHQRWQFGTLADLLSF